MKLLTKSEGVAVLDAAARFVRRSPASRSMTLGKALWNTGALGLDEKVELTLDTLLNQLIEYDFFNKEDKDVLALMQKHFIK